LSADPENVVAHVGQALVCEQRGDAANAHLYIQRAYELQPNNPHIRREYERLLPPSSDDETQVKLTPAALARLYLIEEMYQSARQELDVLVRDDPTRFDLRVALAEALFRLGQLRECAKQAQEILTTLPYCVKANLLLGYAWVESGVREGEVYMKRAREIDPEGIFARYLFGERTLIKFEKPQLPSVEEAEAEAGKEVGAILAEEPADLAASLSTFEASLVRDETQTAASPEASTVATGEAKAAVPAQAESPAHLPLPANRPLIATAMNRLPSWLLEEIAVTQPSEPATAEKEPAAALPIEPAVSELTPADQDTLVEPAVPTVETKPAEEALPTWVEEIGRGEPAQPVELEPVHDMFVPGETLHAEGPHDVEAAVTEPVAESLTTAPLAETLPTAAVQAPAAEGETFPYPDWLMRLAAAPAQPERAVEETAPITAPVVEQPIAAEPVETPDWVQEIAHPPAVEPITAQVPEVEPARLEQITAQEPAAVSGEAVPYPDWLMNLAATRPSAAVEIPPAVPVEPEKQIEVTAPVEAPVVEPPIAVEPVQAPDWVQEIAHPSTVEPAHLEPITAPAPEVEPARSEQISAQEPTAVSGEAVPYPDWVQETAHPVSEVEHAPELTEPVKAPDWVQEIVHPQAVEPIAAQEPVAEPAPFEPIAAQESVVEPAYVEPARVEAIPAEGPAVVSEEVIPYPDWLINLSVIQPAAVVEMPPAVSVEPEKQIEVAAPVVEQPIAPEPVAAEEPAPAIAVEPVQEVEPVARIEEPILQPAQVSPEPEHAIPLETPAWLQEIVAKQKAETLSAEATTPAAYPDWLLNLAAPGTAPSSVTSPSAVESGAGSMPEYMDSLSAAREPSPAAATREPEPAPLPAWLTAPSEPAQAEITPAPPTPSSRTGNVPDWIKTLSAEQAREPAPTPEPSKEPAVPERPAPGKLDVESLLRHARAMAETPNLSGAVKEYEYILHRAPSALHDIISDLEHMLTLPKFPHSAHRVLGDAYSLAGRYKESVEQYRQVLGRWQR
jgi:tetratricopeptide (TPR) repeat protein